MKKWKWLKFVLIAFFLLFITRIFVKAAFIERGYFTIGAEWVAAPLGLFFIYTIVITIKDIFRELKGDKNCNENNSR